MQKKITPLMQQFFDIKAAYSDTLLFFQVGDFYELFFEDAKTAAAFLGIALTSRGTHDGEPIPLCGVPVHAKDHYLHKLIKGGFKVAVCDQLEEAKPGKLVKRDVAQVMTPGTLTDSQLLDEKSASYLFAFYPGETEWALVFGELLTAQMWVTVIPAGSDRILESELSRFFPDELLIPNVKAAKSFTPFFKKQGYFTTVVDGSIQEQEPVLDQWVQQFPEQNRKQIADHDSLRMALFYFYAYLSKTQRDALDQFTQFFMYQSDDFLLLDAPTQRNLELTRNSNDGARAFTLLSVLDGAATPMGSRMIKKWIQRPLIKKEAILQRQHVLSLFISDVMQLQMMQQLLSPIGDIERVIGRIILSRGQLHDYIALRNCLQILPSIKELLSQHRDAALLVVIEKHIGSFHELHDYLRRALVADLSSSHSIAQGFDKELDYMRGLISASNDTLLALEKNEQQATGIGSLKVRYNNVHGYYIEVTNANKHLVPERYQRRQTLVGKERYTTPELSQLAYDIERSHAKIADREKELFSQVKLAVSKKSTQLRKLAHALAHLDALHGFAKVAYNNGYTQPQFTDSRDIMITDGKHPIVEVSSETGFIPNDTQLTDAQSLWIITGPNMGGKSTYLRQVALISVMAQCGSFVPAKNVRLPILDRIFTRIGAGDNLAAGKSTFLVEMEETASICTQATQNSLVILDEVGRGTSTFDGLAIAQAVIEYLYEKVGARCLFATHYHELTQLNNTYSGIAPFYAASKKTEQGIVFLYKMIQGVADGSFGVEVAKLAQLPQQVIHRSQELLSELTRKEGVHIPQGDAQLSAAYERIAQENGQLKAQLAQMQLKQSLNEQLKQLSLDDLSPKQAFDLVWKWKEQSF